MKRWHRRNPERSWSRRSRSDRSRQEADHPSGQKCSIQFSGHWCPWRSVWTGKDWSGAQHFSWQQCLARWQHHFFDQKEWWPGHQHYKNLRSVVPPIGWLSRNCLDQKLLLYFWFKGSMCATICVVLHVLNKKLVIANLPSMKLYLLMLLQAIKKQLKFFEFFHWISTFVTVEVFWTEAISLNFLRQEQ